MIRSVHRLSRFLLTCAAQVHFWLLTCPITSVTFVFSLTHMFVFCPDMWCLTYSFPSLIVRLLACSLLGWWVPMFARRMSLLEVRTSCRLVSSSISQCYPWRCRCAGRMLSIRPFSSSSLLVLVFVYGVISLSVGIWLLSLCRWTVIELLV